MKIILIFIMILQLNAELIEYDIKPSNLKSSKYMNIEILDSKELKFDDMDDLEVTELSDIAYHDGWLYAVSDNGYLYRFNIEMKNSKISKLSLKKAFKLKSKKGKKLKKKSRDSEGLVYEDGRLFISFERKHRVDEYSLDGKKIKSYKIHKDLQNRDNYKSENKGLEALCYSKKYGVITAPEKPLNNKDEKYHTLYAKNKTWKFKVSGSITALEFMDEDSVMVLEREYDFLRRMRVATLTKLSLVDSKNSISKTKVLAKLDTDDGWNIDNFEGLTKVDKGRYLMVSDDNGMFYQKTLLVLFKVE